MVECGFKMAASNTLSNGHSVQRRSGGNAGGASQNNKSVLAFQCQLEHHQDSARLHSNGNCGENKQYRGDFFSSKDPGRRKRVCCQSTALNPCWWQVSWHSFGLHMR